MSKSSHTITRQEIESIVLGALADAVMSEENIGRASVITVKAKDELTMDFYSTDVMSTIERVLSKLMNPIYTSSGIEFYMEKLRQHEGDEAVVTYFLTANLNKASIKGEDE